MTLREQAKAVTSGVVAGLGALVTALADGGLSSLEWAVVGLAAVSAYGAVYGVRQPASLPALTSGELLELAERVADRERR